MCYAADTTGLQSSTAVLELNGSITVTCTFATGASSTGCHVTIFGINVTGYMINRPNGVIQVFRQHNYFYAHAHEVSLAILTLCKLKFNTHNYLLS